MTDNNDELVEALKAEIPTMPPKKAAIITDDEIPKKPKDFVEHSADGTHEAPNTVENPPPLLPPKRTDAEIIGAAGVHKRAKHLRLSVLNTIEELDDLLRQTEGDTPPPGAFDILVLLQQQAWSAPKLMAAYGMDLLSELVRRYAQDMEIQKIVCDMCSTMSFLPEGRSVLAKSGVLRQLIPVLHRYSSNESCATSGAKLLLNFTVVAEVREWLLSLSPVSVVCGYLEQHTDADVLKESFRFLTNMSFQPAIQGVNEYADGFRDQQYEIIEKSNAVHAIKTALQATMEMNSSAVHYEALRAIFNLSYRNASNKIKFVEAGYIQVIADSLQAHTSVETVLMYGFQILINLCLLSEEYRQKIAQTAVIHIVASAKDINNAKLYNKLMEFEAALDGSLAIQGNGNRPPGDLLIDQNTYTWERSIPIGFLVRGLDKRVKASQLSGDLLIYIPFFICFLFFFLVPSPGVDSHYVLAGTREQLEGNELPDIEIYKGWYDLRTVDDFYAWLGGVCIPTLWPDNDGTSGRFILGNVMPVGSVRIRSLHTKFNSCDVNQGLYETNQSTAFTGIQAFSVTKNTIRDPTARGTDLSSQNEWADVVGTRHNDDCYAPLSSSSEDKSLEVAFTESEIPGIFTTRRGEYRDCPISTFTTGRVATYHCGGYTVDIPFNSSYSDVNKVMQHLQSTRFIDPQSTRFVAVEMFFYSVNTDLFLSSVMFLEVAAGGLMLGKPQHRIFTVWSEKEIPQTIYDCLFMIFVFYYVYKFAREFIREKRVYSGRPLKYFFKVWNVMELVNLTVFIIVFAMKIRWVYASSNLGTFHVAISEFPEALYNVLIMFSFIRYFNAVNTIICFLKFLKFVEMKDGLNVLTRTIATVQSQLVGLLSIFLVITFGFALAGNSLYGLSMFEFRSLSSTYSHLMRIVLGEFQYEEMKKENKFLTGLYFSFYITLALFMYMNFIIAVITDGFSEVLAKQYQESVVDQVNRAVDQARWVFSFKAVVKRFQMMQRNKTLSSVLRDVLNNCVVPLRERMRSHQYWLKLKSKVVTGVWRNFPAFAEFTTPKFKNLGEGKRDAIWRKLLFEMGGSVPIDVPVNEIPVAFSKIKEVIQIQKPSCLKILGEVYLRNVWQQLVYQYERQHDLPAQRQRSAEVAVVKGVCSEKASEMEGTLATMKGRLSSIEHRINKILELAAPSKKTKAQRGSSAGSRTPPTLSPGGDVNSAPLNLNALNVRLKKKKGVNWKA